MGRLGSGGVVDRLGFRVGVSASLDILHKYICVFEETAHPVHLTEI